MVRHESDCGSVLSKCNVNFSIIHYSLINDCIIRIYVEEFKRNSSGRPAVHIRVGFYLWIIGVCLNFHAN